MVAAEHLARFGLQRCVCASSSLTAHPAFCFQVPPMLRSKYCTAFVIAGGKIASTWFIACFSDKKTLLVSGVTHNTVK